MPTSKKPRKKYTKPIPPLEVHRYCPAEVRYVHMDPTSPHKAYLYCTLHEKHIMWLSADMAPKWQQVLSTRPQITSQ
jgi:hypothetical protein